MTPRISVVMIFLNAERFIRDSIASVMMQDRGDWELILVDDGSSDASTGYARAAAEADPRIRYFEHPDHVNLGMAITRNLGLRQARGDYVIYLDSDDILFPAALSQMAEPLDRDPNIGLSCSATLFWNWDPAIEDEPDKMQAYREWADSRVEGARFLAALIADEGLHPANCGTMVRRQAMLDVGGFDLAFAGIYEDTSLLTELLLRHDAYIARSCRSAYRMHMGSHCHVAAKEGDYAAAHLNPARLRYLDWAEAYLNAADSSSPELARAIRDARMPEVTRYSLPKRLVRLLRNPTKLLARLRPTTASVAEALSELARFHRARGDLHEEARLEARIAALG